MKNGYYLYSMVFTMFSALVLASFARLRDNRRLSLAWQLSMVATACWSLGRALMSMADSAGQAMIWLRLSYMGSIWLAPLWLWVSCELTGKRLSRWIVGVVIVISVAGSVANFTPWFIGGVKPKLGFNFYDDSPGAIFNIWSVSFTVLLVMAHLIVFREWRSSLGFRRLRLFYFLASGFIGFSGSATTFPLVNNIPIYPFGVLAVSGSTMLMSYSVLRHNVMDTNLLFRYGSTWFMYVLLGMGLLVAPLVVLGVRIDGAWVMSMLVAVGGAPFLFKHVSLGIISFIDKLPPFKGRYHTTDDIQSQISRINESTTVKEWAFLVVSSIKSLYAPQSASLLIYENIESAYLVTSSFGLNMGKAGFLTLPFKSPLSHHMTTDMMILTKEFAFNHFKGDDLKAVKSDLDFLEAVILAPLYLKGKLHAVLSLASKKDGTVYNELDIANLGNLLRGAEHTLNAILAGISTEQMTAVWAHDLLKPVSSKGTLQYIVSLWKGQYGELSPEGKAAVGLYLRDAEFLAANLTRVAAPNAKEEYAIGPFHPAEMFVALRNKYVPQSLERRIRWEVVSPPENLRILGDPAMLEHRAIPNLVDNAFRHTPEGGTVELGYRIEGEQFIVHVRDTGPGIRKEDQGKLFQAGAQAAGGKKGLAGLGLYSVKMVVEGMGGRVWVESDTGKGAAFSFALPLAE
jgi:signal transduction histidine kinase